MSVCFFVAGDPRPQGSKSSFWSEKANKVITLEGKGKGRVRLKLWRDQVKVAGEEYCLRNRHTAYAGPVAVVLEFVIPKPKSKPRWKIWPDVPPDIDKLERAFFDGLTEGKIVDDDKRICVVHKRERYAEPEEESGCWVMVWELPEERAA